MTDFYAVLDRSQIDFDFYLALRRNPEEALAGYELTDAERSALTANRAALWQLIAPATVAEREPIEEGGPPGPPPPGPPPPGPPPPGPPPPGPPPPGPPPPGPPPPPPGPPPPPPPGVVIGPGPVPPPPPPPPGGIGIRITGHHDWLNIFQRLTDVEIGELVTDPVVVGAVQSVRTAASPAERLEAVSRLMERIG